MTSKVIPAKPTTEIPRKETTGPRYSSQIQSEEKSVHNVYTKLKQVSCCADKEWVKNEWGIIERVLGQRQYRRQKQKILEKLDDADTYAPIHYAVRMNNQFVSEKLLVDHKCDVNLLGFDGQTSLHLAACSSQIERDTLETKKPPILSILLEHPNIHLNKKDNQKRTPLHHAIMRKHLGIARALISKGAKIETGDVQGATPVHYACRYLKYDDVLNLFGPIDITRIDLKTVDGKTPHGWAVEYENDDILKKYLSHSDRSENPNEGVRNVVYSTGINYRRSAEVLSDIVLRRNNEDNELYLVCRQLHRSQKIPDNLITNESMKFQDNEGLTPLMIAVKYRRVECVTNLLKTNKCDQNLLQLATYHLKRTVVHLCAELPCKRETEPQNDKKTAIIIDLVSKKVKSLTLVSEPDALGNTPLHICAQSGNVYMCEKLLSLTNHLSSAQTKKTSYSNESKKSDILSMLSMKNSKGLTPLHEAIENKQVPIVKLILNLTGVSNPEIVEITDERGRTSLHMAASVGHAEILQLLLAKQADVNANDINEKTPLHEAAGQCDSDEENIKDRIKCIDRLVEENGEVNALSINHESPLHIACRYGSSSVVEALLKHGADLLQINRTGFNCLEVAIEEKNKQVVKYLIEHDRIFELMRNAQTRDRSWCKKCRMCCVLHCWQRSIECHKVDTPMRKLIISMPDMAYQILEKCTTTIGAERSEVHRQFFNYEFLEDIYSIKQWSKVNSDANNEQMVDEPYTFDISTQVSNHPLFLMAEHDRFQLMAHPLSKNLVYNKFWPYSCLIFIASFVLYALFLIVFTMFALSARHPAEYYNLTGFPFEYGLCENVARAIEKNSTAVQESGYRNLKRGMYVMSILILVKNVWSIFVFFWVDLFKTFPLFGEITALILGYIFLFDADFQQNVLMRCPVQWQIGAFGLLIGYLALFFYLQYIPIIGLYVIMLKAIFIRFLLVTPVVLVFVCGFALTFYMLFQNVAAFESVAASLVKIAMMSIGEINYDDLLYNDKGVMAYYKVSYVVLTLFVITMVILITNLLIGLAVGETAELMKEAKQTRLDNLYELAAGMEILKLQSLIFYNICCRCCFIAPESYYQKDLNKQWGWWKNVKSKVLKSCAREVDEDDQESAWDDNQEKKQMSALEEIRIDLHTLRHPVTSQTKSQRQAKA